MAAARLGETAKERLVARLEIEHAAVDAAAAQRGEVLGQRSQRRAPCVDAHADALVTGLGEEVDGLEKKRRRQIVDAVITAVLEDVEGDALARARKSAHEYKLHHSPSGRITRPQARNRAPVSASP